jgi:DNA-binding MarR family transcriptional regulator
MGAQVIRARGAFAPASKSEIDSRDVLDSIRHLVRSLRESSRAAEKKVGLSGAQLFVLQTLARSGSLSLNEVAALTLTHQSSVSVVISRLVAKRLVSRAPAPDDGRRLQLTLTASGRALLRRSPGVAQEQLIDGLRRMSGPERRLLALSLRRLLDRMGVAGDAPMFFEEDAHGKR